MRDYFISDLDVIKAPAANAFIDPSFASVKTTRGSGRRAMLFSALAGMGVVGMGAGVFASTNLTPAAVRAAASASAPKIPVINPGPALTTPSAADRQEWALFKAALLNADGRIIDTGNHGVSHSEGQGVGMLFAVAFDDHAAFDQIHSWTKRHLTRTDGLHAWRYVPNAANPVSDPNNATDGDIYIAAALQRAARRWNRPDYSEAAARTAQAIHDRALARVGERLILMPAAAGFDHPDRVVVNLSYYILPLLVELDGAYPSEDWEQVRRDGVSLIQQARFGRWGLPPDWIDVSKTTGTVTLASSFPARFSWDAVRVPLFLAWAGEAPDVVKAASAFWNGGSGRAPAWVDLRSGEVAGYNVCPGVRAIGAVASQSRAARAHAVEIPSVVNDTYYSAALTLMSRMARAEMAAAITES